MTNAWPDIADVAAALTSDPSEAGSSDPKTSDAKVVSGTVDEAKDKATVDAVAKAAADALKAESQKTTSAPDLTTLAAEIKKDPRKFIASLPEDVLQAIGEPLYPGLHKVLSKRDREHAEAIRVLNQQHETSLAEVAKRLEGRFDEILRQTMEPEAFEALTRERTAKDEAERKARAPKPEDVARDAAIQAHSRQAWGMIEEEGFPLSADDPDTRAIWEAGWEESDPVKSIRLMRAKARELREAKKQSPAPKAGQLAVTEDVLKKIVQEAVEKRREEDLLAAGLANPGTRAGAVGKTSPSKAPTWDENRAALTEAIRNLQR